MTTEMTTNLPNIIYTDAEVIVDPRDTPAEAIWIREGRIAAVGSNEEVLAAAGPDVDRQSVAGATIIPGLIDTHPHLLHFSAFLAPLVDLTRARDHEEIVELIRSKALDTPKGEWIQTTPVGEPHYFQRRSFRNLAEGQLPDRKVLDRATSDHPVIIQAFAPVLPNVIALNSAALSRLGIDASTKDRVANVWIEKDAAGNPTGILRGAVTNYYNSDPFFAGLSTLMPPLIQPELAPEALAKAMATYNGLGITTIYEGHGMDFEHIEGYQAMHDHGALSLRVHVVPELQPAALPGDRPKTDAEIDATLEKALAMRSVDDDWLRIDGITSATFGPCFNGTMAWNDGYLDAWGNRTTGNRIVSKAHNRRAFEFCAEHDLRLNLCACSPDEHDEHIAMTGEILAKYDMERTNWIIQHGYLVREDQAKKYAELGFDMTVSTSFTFGKADMLAERIGPHALEVLNPLRQFLDAGLKVAGGMDWGPCNPFEHMQLAVTHKMFPSGRTNAGPAQVVTREEAYEMWTENGAKLIGWEGIGSLHRGNHADLAILDRNPITCDIDALPETRVLRTHVGGRIVHDDGFESEFDFPVGGHDSIA